MRLLLTLAVLMAGCLAGSYAIAPVPKEKDKPKTTAEKLIGTWKLVLSGDAIPTGNVTADFKKDGKVDFCNDGSIRRATYKLEKKTIRFHCDQGPVRDWEVVIKSLTNEKLVAGDQHDNSVYKKITVENRK